MAAALPLVAAPPLERLSQLSIINLHQTSSGYKGNNYTVFGEGEEVLFTLNEIVPDTSYRGGARRAFQFNGMDTTGSKLFSFHRPTGRICNPERVELFMNEVLVSHIHKASTYVTPIFNINDAQDNPVIRLKGPKYDEDYFQLQSNTKTGIGAIQKKYRGWKKELWSCKDDYSINFPVDLAVPFKIAVIVACVYIDFRFHEYK